MRVLVVTKIFPNRKEPLSSPFNRQQFAALQRLPGVEVEVVASIPWFPGIRLLDGKSSAAALTDLPATDEIDGLPVRHPRVLYLPRYGHALSAGLYAASLLPDLLRHRARYDVLLGAWAYPDAAAVVALGRLLGLPTVVKCHGSDINVVAQRASLGWQLRRLLPGANRVVVVSRALGRRVEALGVEPGRIDVVYNGVDDKLFRPRDRQAARQKLGLPADRRILLYVGRLEREKGVVDLLDAWEQLARAQPHFELVLLGNGKAKAEAERRATRHGGRLRVIGARPLGEIPDWLAACDLLTLPSWNEGTPNVVLEALAAGRRVVASDVGGIPDLLDPDGQTAAGRTDTRLGRLVPAHDIGALAAALVRTAEEWYDPAVVSSLGSHGDWNQSAQRLLGTLQAACDEGPR